MCRWQEAEAVSLAVARLLYAIGGHSVPPLHFTATTSSCGGHDRTEQTVAARNSGPEQWHFFPRLLGSLVWDLGTGTIFRVFQSSVLVR